MIIAQSSIALSATHAKTVKEEKTESLQILRPGGASQQFEMVSDLASSGLLQVQLANFMSLPDLSSEALALQPEKNILALDEALDEAEQLEFSIVRLLVEHLTGEKVELFKPSDLQPSDSRNTDAAQQAAPPSSAWGLAYDYYASYQETEKTTFNAEGKVTTADGKEITLDIELNMSREFFTEESVSLRLGAALKDPLVINYDGPAAQLTDNKFSFDIDADGHEEQISFVRSGSGFLALDKNNDGTVNDGTELFGAITGEGFAELAEFDQDNNQWIDGNDEIFDRLRIWSKDGDGNDHLVALGSKGVGAIYLGHTATPFEIKDENNQLQGQVRDSGLYLNEDGSGGTIQQLDLVV